MTAGTLVDSVKERLVAARSKAEIVGAHGQDVLKLGSQTLLAAKEVVRQARYDTATVLSAASDDLKRTLKEGVAQIGDRLSRLTTPTRKEEAIARKVEVKARKKRKRAGQDEISDAYPAAV